MSEQLLSTGSAFGLHEDAADEVPRLLRGVRREQRVGGLGGDLEYGGHGLELGPRGFLREHLHDRTGQAPAEDTALVRRAAEAKQAETKTTKLV